jgi:Leucine-rich repeat (LRR) protein
MLGYNFLRSLPDQVLEMPSINRLSLDSNPIQIEWKDTMLPSCKLLSIGDTKITNIPQGVANRLIQLVWCNVKDIQIPQNMKSIKYLDVRNNELDEKQIEKLKLFGNTVVL